MVCAQSLVGTKVHLCPHSKVKTGWDGDAGTDVETSDTTDTPSSSLAGLAGSWEGKGHPFLLLYSRNTVIPWDSNCLGLLGGT